MAKVPGFAKAFAGRWRIAAEFSGEMAADFRTSGRNAASAQEVVRSVNFMQCG